MATETIQLSAFIPAEPMRVYVAWLSSEEHSAFTGGKAECDDKVGGQFTAWDGYIEGTNQQLLEGRKIVQAWRTTEFPEGAEDSLLTVHFDPEQGGTRLTILHSRIPEGQGRDYEEGWGEYYLEPLVEYFGKKAPRKAAAKRKPAAKKAARAKQKAAPAKKKVAAKK